MNLINFLFNHTPLLYLTQSLWRDEAFSVLIAQHNPLDIIQITANDFNPPLYYLLLHFWMKIFGQTEIVVRLLSFVFHIFTVIISYKFAKTIFKPKFFIFNFSFLILFNPALLYFAFEARMYSMLVFFATASMYFFYTLFNNPAQDIRHRGRIYAFSIAGYILFTVLGLYTQPFMTLVIASQIAYLLFFHRQKIFLLIGLLAYLLICLFYLPWLFVLKHQFSRSAHSWIYPPDANLLQSVLANLFLGFEGTPGFFWPYVKIISLILLILFIIAAFDRRSRLFLLWLFIPLSLTLTVSFFKPIFVNRYLIYLVIPEIFLIAIAIPQISKVGPSVLKEAKHSLFKCIGRRQFPSLKSLSDSEPTSVERGQLFLLKLSLFRPSVTLKRRIRASFEFYCLIALLLFFNLWFAPFHRKTDLRGAINSIIQQAGPRDLLVSETPLTFFEANYYFSDRSRVFLYKPNPDPIPPYLGSALIPPSKWLPSLQPTQNTTIFLLKDNGEVSKVKTLK